LFAFLIKFINFSYAKNLQNTRLHAAALTEEKEIEAKRFFAVELTSGGSTYNAIIPSACTTSVWY